MTELRNVMQRSLKTQSSFSKASFLKNLASEYCPENQKPGFGHQRWTLLCSLTFSWINGKENEITCWEDCNDRTSLFYLEFLTRQVVQRDAYFIQDHRFIFLNNCHFSNWGHRLVDKFRFLSGTCVLFNTDCHCVGRSYRLSLVGLLNDEPLLPSGLAVRGRGRKGLEFPRLLILSFLAQERLAACFGDARLLPHDA